MTRTEYCPTKKVPFQSMEFAQAHADFLRSRHGTNSTPYYCDHCGQYHNSTQAQRPSPSQRPVRFLLGDVAKVRS